MNTYTNLFVWRIVQKAFDVLFLTRVSLEFLIFSISLTHQAEEGMCVCVYACLVPLFHVDSGNILRIFIIASSRCAV